MAQLVEALRRKVAGSIPDGVLFASSTVFERERAVAQLVEALSRKVAGSIPDGVIGIFKLT